MPGRPTNFFRGCLLRCCCCCEHIHARRSSTGEEGAAISRDAFHRLYQEQLGGIWRYVKTRVPGYHEAQDVTHEVFARAWRAWPTYDPARSSMATWLYAIAHHTVVDWYRRQRPGGTPRQTPMPDEQLPPGLPSEDEPGAALLQEELLVTLQQSLTTLSDREREAIALRFTGGLRAAEVGQILGLSEGATKMMIHRAIQKLKAVIANA